MNQTKARTLRERREAALTCLRSGGNLWLATASDGHGPHLIPVSFWWAGSRLITATLEDSRTLNNIRVQPRVRAAIGSTSDVMMIDAAAAAVVGADLEESAIEGYEQVSGVPRSTPGYVYIQLAPQRIQVWRGPAEFSGRTVMRAGEWLDNPVD
jgi:general stress protein 26